MENIIVCLICMIIIVVLAIYWTVWKIRTELNQNIGKMTNELVEIRQALQKKS